MKKVIINGANGYVASNFINELLNQNYKVIALVRGNKKYSSSERMNSILADINDGDFVMPDNLKVFSYSLCDKNFGIEEDVLEEIFDQDADYYHFAASLKFDSSSKEEIFRTNIDGVENSINIFSEFATEKSRFLYISTAYSCGKTDEVFEERFYENEDISRFRNYYEQSKRYAENIVREHMEVKNLNVHIIRLSQVVGDNDSGITKTDYGIFDFAKRVHNLAYRNPNSVVRVKVDPEATQSLIPINTVVHYLMRTIVVQELPVIMNFIAKNAVKNIHIVNNLCKLLPIQLVADKTIERSEMNAIERIISIGMTFTGSYVSTNIQFCTRNLDKIVLSGNNYEANEHTVFKMLQYFLENLSEKKSENLCTKAS